MKTLVFDISGKYGMFKKPYSPLSPVSFPVPPPTAVYGLIGAMMGLSKDEYLEKVQRDGFRLAIGLRSEVKRYRAGLNLLKSDGSITKFTTGLVHTQIPAEFIKDITFRIWFHHPDSDFFDELVDRVSDDKYAYTPCLGNANCMAQVKFVSLAQAQRRKGEKSLGFSSIVPRTQIDDISFRSMSRMVRIRLPFRMDTDRTITEYADVYLDEEGGAVQAIAPEYYDIEGENVLLL